MNTIKEKTEKIIKILQKEYPQAKTALTHANPLELLVATMLSAQSTDVTVNKITPALFKKYRTAADYAKADLSTLEKEIYSTGFYRNKAKNVIAAAKVIAEKYYGKVPQTMDELITLPGVARKTANIVLYSGYDVIAGIAVDTHVRRLSQRLGFSNNENPEKIEQDLMVIVPKKLWGQFSYLLIDHGRKICIAKKPLCPQCVINKLCPSYRIFFPHT